MKPLLEELTIPQRVRASMIKQRDPVFYIIIVLLVFLLLLMLAGVLWANYRQSQALLRSYAEDIMISLVDSVETHTEVYLAPAEQLAKVTRSLILEGLLDPEDDLMLELYFLQQLAHSPSITGIFVGRPDGSFVFVNREEEAYNSKFVRTSGAREVELVSYDIAQVEQFRSFDPDDNYDPRQRPWYQLAQDAGGLVWTAPYLFFTSQRPGVTAAIQVSDFGTVGVDIEITRLSKLIDNVPISDQGFAFIQNDAGMTIAYPDFAKLLQGLEGNNLPKIHDLGNPVTNKLLDSFPGLAGPPPQKATFKEFSFDKQDYYALYKGFELIDLPWTIVVQAPVEDFNKVISARFRRSLFEIIAIGVFVCLLAIPLGFSVTRPFTRLHQRATLDPLTGLLNRTEFLVQAKSHLANAERNDLSAALMMLDLDNFKPVNDQFGHHAGDDILQTVATRLKVASRQGDLVARLGGDEFTLLLFGVSEDIVLDTAERIRAEISERPIEAVAQQHHIGATAGVIVVKQPLSLEELMNQADHALIHGKTKAKNKTYLA